MPQEWKQINGRWQLTGNQSADDLIPYIPAEQPQQYGPTGKPRPPKPKPRPKPQGFMQQLWNQTGGRLVNDLTYELRQLKTDPARSAQRFTGNAVRALVRTATTGTIGPGGNQLQLGVVGAGDNALRMSYSLFQRATGRKTADPSAGRFGQGLDAGTDLVYRALGAKPPSEMSQAERDYDMFQRSVALNLGLGLVPGAGLGAAGARTAAGAVTRGAAALGLNEFLSTFLDDNTGGNIVNLVNDLGGFKLPGGVDVGNDDMIDAAGKSLVPNAIPGALLGSVGGFANLVRRKRAGRLVEEAQSSRNRLERAGVQEVGEDGTARFTPAVTDPGQAPTFADANRMREEQLGMTPAAGPTPPASGTEALSDLGGIAGKITENMENGLWDGMQGVGAMRTDPIVLNAKRVELTIRRPLTRDEFTTLIYGVYGKADGSPVTAQHWGDQVREQFGVGAPSPGAAPPPPAPAPVTPEQQIARNNQEIEQLQGELGEVEVATPNPDAPEADGLLRTLDELNDDELQAVAASPGPVVDATNQTLQARPEFQADPSIRSGLVAAPTDRLSRLYLEGAGGMEPWEQQIEAIPVDQLRSLVFPGNNPEMAARIMARTGKEFEELTRDDILGMVRAMNLDGQTVLPNRMAPGQSVVDVNQIDAEPETFQFKGGVNESGEQLGNSLGGVDMWDPTAEGVIQVWRAPDGRLKVVNGHNRLALAKRLGIPSARVEELVATTPQAARAQGAIANISAGNGTPFDAAKFLRETGITDEASLQRAGIPINSGWGQQGLALSRLPDDLFQQAINEQLPMRKAVLIGQSGLDPQGMRSAWRLALDKPGMTEGVLREMMAFNRANPGSADAAVDSQTDLLKGTQWDWRSDPAMLARAELVDSVGRMLSSDRKLFGTVGRQAGRLEGAGNTIDRAGAREISQEAGQALAVFDQLKYLQGPVADLLNRGVDEVLAGGKPSAVAQIIKADLATAIESAMTRQAAAPEVPPAAAMPAEAPGQTGLFGDAPAPEAAPVRPLTADEREALKIEVVKRAAAAGEIRPSATPVPDLPSPARVEIDEALADIETRGGIEPGTPGAQAVADEIRLAREFSAQDAAMRQDQEDALRDAFGYEQKTFEEKKELGMIDGWDPDEPQPAAAAPAPSASSFAGIPDVKPEHVSPPIRNGRTNDRIDSVAKSFAFKLGAPINQIRDLLTQKGIPDLRATLGDEKYNAALELIEMGYFSSGARGESLLYLDTLRKFLGLPATADAEFVPMYTHSLQRTPTGRTAQLTPAQLQQLAVPANEIKQTAESIVRLVGGNDIFAKRRVQFDADYEQVIVPAEWGGDGVEKGISLGWYNHVQDILRINGLFEGGMAARTQAEWAQVVFETAAHEAFHRLQFRALTPQQLNVLNSVAARKRVQMIAEALGHGDASYKEQQALVFQKYGVARIQGKDPVVELFGIMGEAAGASDDLKSSTTYKVLKKLASVFDAIADYVQKTKNLLEGNGFQSVRSIYDAAAQGLIARQQPDITRTGGAPGLLMNPGLRANWELGNAIDGATEPFGPLAGRSASNSLAPRPTRPEALSISRDTPPDDLPRPGTKAADNQNRAQIRANNQAMDDLRQKAMKEGC